MAFETAHGELFQPPYGVLNLRAIEQYFADEKVQWTADNLGNVLRELKGRELFQRCAHVDSRHGMAIHKSCSPTVTRKNFRNCVISKQRQSQTRRQPDCQMWIWNAGVQSIRHIPHCRSILPDSNSAAERHWRNGHENIVWSKIRLWEKSTQKAN